MEGTKASKISQLIIDETCIEGHSYVTLNAQKMELLARAYLELEEEIQRLGQLADVCTFRTLRKRCSNCQCQRRFIENE